MRQAKRPAMTTTLYGLISTLHLYVDVQDDQIIAAIVTYLLRTGQIRRTRKSPTDLGCLIGTVRRWLFSGCRWFRACQHAVDWSSGSIRARPPQAPSDFRPASEARCPIPRHEGSREPGERGKWHVSLKQRRTVSCLIPVNHLDVPLPGKPGKINRILSSQ